MSSLNTDVIVLGAGVAGVSAALHLQSRGRDVVIADKHAAAGEETSFGNAGLVEAASFFPLGFPRGLAALARYAMNRSPEAHYHLSALPSLAPWLFAYWRASTPERLAQAARALAPLVQRALPEHKTLLSEAGAVDLLRETGWTKLYRSEATLAKALADAKRLDAFGAPHEPLGRHTLAAREPTLNLASIAGAIHYPTPASVSDPGAVVKAYADLFIARGGRLVQGDARSLVHEAEGWRLGTTAGALTAPVALVALGPWAAEALAPLGFRFPLGFKRGYHMHYGLKPGAAAPSRPLLDADGGYVLAPQLRGLRMTTGVEFARRDALQTPVQIGRCEPFLRDLLPGLGARLDPKPWVGARPCLPDMLPVIGPAPGQNGLWLDFGHQHLGFTLGPATGRLVAEMMTGETPFADPAPFAPTRF